VIGSVSRKLADSFTVHSIGFLGLVLGIVNRCVRRTVDDAGGSPCSNPAVHIFDLL
jgi:hypothetical protein